MDTISKTARSAIMAAIRGKDTAPELFIRSKIHRAGFRYCIHVRSLPGVPDIVFPRYRIIVFVHGCFWHGHACPRGRRPTSNRAFWNKKLSRNISRDAENKAALEKQGWKVMTIWTCEIDSGIRNVLKSLKRLKQEGA